MTELKERSAPEMMVAFQQVLARNLREELTLATFLADYLGDAFGGLAPHRADVLTAEMRRRIDTGNAVAYLADVLGVNRSTIHRPPSTVHRWLAQDEEEIDA